MEFCNYIMPTLTYGNTQMLPWTHEQASKELPTHEAL